jgi:hypothetical protein
MGRRSPLEILPPAIARAVRDESYWFVIGGQAVRCFCPYRPSRDVDFGVIRANDAEELLAHLRSRGAVELLERSRHTIHLTFDGVDVSIFVLKKLAAHVHDRALDVTGILATKTHALLERGLRRDFFDLYVMLELHRLGVMDALRALREVYREEVNEGLVLRALAFFDDAESEPPLPGEGHSDFDTVKSYFATAVAALVSPPLRPLDIQRRQVDVSPAPKRPRKPRR